MHLFVRRLRSELPSLVGWSILVAITSLGYMAFYRVMITSGTMKDIAALIDNLPAVLRGLIGGGAGIDTFSGFVQSLVFGGIPPLYLTIFAVLGALSLVARDVDGGNIEFLLSLPVARRSVLASRGAVLAIELMALEAVLVVTSWAGGMAAGKSPDMGQLCLAGAAGWLLFVGLAGLFAWLAVFIDDYQNGVFLLLGLGLLLFFSGAVMQGQASQAPATQAGRLLVDALKILNPYSWLNLGEVFRTGHLPMGGVAGLVAFGVVTWTGAVASFERKQISG